jgi:tRNA 2-selenouridine synthase
MISSQLVFVDVPFVTRVNRLVAEYGNFPAGELEDLIRKIGRRMGGDKANASIKALEQGNISEAVAIVLHYYDKSYKYALSKREKNEIFQIEVDSDDLQSVTTRIQSIILNSRH